MVRQSDTTIMPTCPQLGVKQTILMCMKQRYNYIHKLYQTSPYMDLSFDVPQMLGHLDPCEDW